MPTFPLDTTVHFIQISLTPVFLLSGIAALLNVYSTRLGRVSDRMDSLAAARGNGADEQTCAEIKRMRRRSTVLDIAIALGTLGAASTCMAILTLFLVAVSNRAVGGILLLFFGMAIVCTLVSVVVFGTEMLLANRALRHRMSFHLAWLSR